MRAVSLTLGIVAGATLLLTLPATAAAARECGGREATIRGGPGSTDIVGTEGADVIVAGGGDDSIQGLGGRDRICGEDGIEGRDRVYGNEGSAEIFGGDEDELHGAASAARRQPGPGRDVYPALRAARGGRAEGIPVGRILPV